MFKLVKYEFRRNLPGIIAITLSVAAMQIYYLVSVYLKNEANTMTSSGLLFVATMMSVGVVFIYSISLYSRELASKSSYLTFMTPNTSTKILGAKLLATLLLGAILALVLGILAVWDFALLSKVFPQLDVLKILADQFLKQVDYSIASFALAVALLAIEFLIEFFTAVVLAYLAITLSSTVLQNHKLKGFLSALLFVGLMALVFHLNSLLPVDYESFVTFKDVAVEVAPMFATDLIFMVGAFIGSAWLLKYKVSL